MVLGVDLGLAVKDPLILFLPRLEEHILARSARVGDS
jgi:hypothetical protein